MLFVLNSGLTNLTGGNSEPVNCANHTAGEWQTQCRTCNRSTDYSHHISFVVLIGQAAQAWHQYRHANAAEYMARNRRPPSQGWKTFLRNHADEIGLDGFICVPTISFLLMKLFRPATI